jgi:hypothetical protein
MLGVVSFVWSIDDEMLMFCSGSDSQTARVLTGKTTAGSTISIESCASICSAYTYFGIEYADEVCQSVDISSRCANE